MENLLKSENLIELHKNLEEFASYHHDKGGQRAHKLVQEHRLAYNEERSHYTSADDKESEIAFKSHLKGYNDALLTILGLLHKTFVK